MNWRHRSLFVRRAKVVLTLSLFSGVMAEVRASGSLARSIEPLATDPGWTAWSFKTTAAGLLIGCAVAACALSVSTLQRRRRRLEAEVVERRQIEDALRASHRRIQDLAGRLITAQEAERTRIARDLHDGVCQDVAAISVDMSHLRQKIGDLQDRDVQELLVSVQRRALIVAESLRVLSHGLHSSILHHVGLVAAVQSDCLEVERHHDMQVRLLANEALEPVNPTTALSLFRITQEALRNSARHGRAQHATVSLVRDASHLTLTIVDDGEGFDVTAARQNGGLGLVSIEERARLVAGQVTIHSERGIGTRISVRVPCQTDEAPGWQFTHEQQAQFASRSANSFMDYR